MFSRPRLIALQVLVVLICAAAGLVVRSALDHHGEGKDADVSSAQQFKPEGPFRLRAGTNRGVSVGAHLIATARKDSVVIYNHPDGKRLGVIRQRVFNRQRIPLTFLAVKHIKGWTRVRLPTRPNQSEAWVKRSAIDFSQTGWRIEVRQKAHQLVVFNRRNLIIRSKIAIGRSVSPTPTGTYFVTDVIKPPDPKGFYGPYALGLSAHSNVYTTFEDGDGQIGIHGTDNPSVIGTDVSHGCIRVSNKLITRLARTVPLGTPVLIKA